MEIVGIENFDTDENKEYEIYLGAREKKEYKTYITGEEKITKNNIHYKVFGHKDKVEKFLSETFGYEYPELLTRGAAVKKQIINFNKK